jgi:SAM-dependent methyltransferase
MQRMPSIELLDEDQGDPRDIQTSFDDLWRINRWLGGVSGSMRLFNRFFRRTGSHPVRILDVGAGDGRMTDYLGRWLRQRYPGAQMVALDRRLSHLQNGRPADRDLRGIVADVRALPFSPESFEIVTCNLFLHHFSGAAAIELLRAMLRSGPASVRQAYTRRELRALAAESGSARVEMIPLHFFRSGMILWKRCSAGL